MHRRHFLKGAAAMAALPVSAASGRSLILLSEAEAAQLKPGPGIASRAAEAMKAGPWSVAYHRPKGSLTAAGPNDFFSEGPYWWPNPNNPNGPYIRRDGVVNPDRFIENDRDLGRMSETVMSLGLAAYFLKDEAAARRAWEVARIWFVDPKTRMNPNLEFGQAIRGVTPGRGIGIIDTRSLIWCAQGLAFLEARFNDPAISKQTRSWFAAYLDWLINSQKGKDEARHGNNHSTWWAAQVAAYALYAGNPKAGQRVYSFYESDLVPRQLMPDGSAPHEEARTRALSYSIMNLDGFALLCRMAKRQGRDLWSFRTKDGAGVLRSLEYLAPYIADPLKWSRPQITPVGRSRGYCLGLAGMDTGRPEWVRLQRGFGIGGGAWGSLLGMVLEQWQN
ncbi:MAG: alginate lyase family protein [Bryobacteraceae bacterium]|nr:alginate lyase family protein [Bryobacteraceae bacterium]